MKQLILRGKKEKKKSWINLINSKFQATCLMFESHVSELLRVYLFTTFDLKKKLPSYASRGSVSNYREK